MRSSVTDVVGWKNFLAVLLAAMCCIPGVLSLAGCDSKEKAPDAVEVAQEGFATPEAAAVALVQAAGNYDVPALMRILGPDGQILVTSEDAVADKNGSLAFAAAARDKQSVAIDPEDANRATLVVGKDDWPLPIPIVKREGKWYFDSKAGIEEVLKRRIGANELNAIQVCRGYVEAQHEYASVQHDGSGLNQYAQRVVSTPGKHDGLAWQNPDGSWGGPVGEGVARVLQEGYTDKSEPFHGYYFKFLKGQGPAAPLGEMNYVVGGAMIGGFALAAAPAQYRVTGVQTFIVGYEGIVYQKDLGPDTLKIFKTMELYNPDKSWQRTDDSW